MQANQLFNSNLKLIIFSLLFILNLNFKITAQEGEYDQLEYFEEEIGLLFDKLRTETDETKQRAINNNIRMNLEEAFKLQESFDYPFDSLKYLYKETTPDKKLRIYNWNIALNDGTYKYYGYLQYDSEKQGKYIVYELYDNSKKTVNPEKQKLDNETWYGALYYNIIQKKYKKEKYYYLFGWDGNDDHSTKKIIEVLHFDKNEKPVFGSPVFKMKKGRNHRVIFEYAKHATMTLMYDRAVGMIIFDLLVPSKSIYEGKYEFYGPEGTYDGFYYEKGKWYYESIVDVRNQRKR